MNKIFTALSAAHFISFFKKATTFKKKTTEDKCSSKIVSRDAKAESEEMFWPQRRRKKRKNPDLKVEYDFSHLSRIQHQPDSIGPWAHLVGGRQTK
jgi:hypothetical protein